MWVKFRNVVVDVSKVLVERGTSMIWVTPTTPVLYDSMKVGAYVNQERAKEVFDEFLAALREGKRLYEFPDA